MKLLPLLALTCALGPAWAAIPLADTLADIFVGRKPHDAVELNLRHQVSLRDGSTVEVVEQLIGTRGGAVSLWQVGGQSYFSEWNGREYAFRGKTLPSRSAAWMEFFLDRTSGEFQDRLLREQFVRRDQLSLLQSSYDPKGDPKTWNTKEKIARHDDVFYRKLGSDLAVVVEGSRGGDLRRSVAFLRGRKESTLRRLEWVSSETAFWDFLNPITLSGLGRVPRVMALSVNGAEKVRSTVSSFRPSKRDALATARVSGKNLPGVLSGDAEEALRWILRYR